MAVSQWIGQWAWVIVPWFWVIIYDDTWFSSPEAGTRTLAIYVSIFCTALALVPALFIKGESSLNDKNLSPITLGNIRSSISTLVKGFKDAANNTPFMRLCVATFFIFNSFQTIAAFSFFIIVYYLFQGDAGAAGIWPTLHGSVGALLTTFLVIPIVTKMSEKWGKKKTFMISQAISILGYILFWFLFIPGKPYMFLFALPLFSFGIGGLFTLMMSMTADTCDLDELNNGLPRKEATFGAIYWWMVKFGTALAGLFSGIIMSYVGFDANLSAQPDGAMTGLRIFYSVLPVIGTAIAIYVMKNYDINEARAKEISETLNKRNAK
jgi:GPH family glycoside/pentoside/hexuronide:cation symporter